MDYPDAEGDRQFYLRLPLSSAYDVLSLYCYLDSCFGSWIFALEESDSLSGKPWKMVMKELQTIDTVPNMNMWSAAARRLLRQAPLWMTDMFI